MGMVAITVCLGYKRVFSYDAAQLFRLRSDGFLYQALNHSVSIF